MNIWSSIVTFGKDLLSPATCAHCMRHLAIRVPLCIDCITSIRPVVSIDLTVNATKTIIVQTVGAYEGPLQTLIRAKHYRSYALAHQAGEIFAQHVTDMVHDHDILVPIPLHWMRYAQRGYNQAEIMAHAIARATGSSMCCALQRTRSTNFQTLEPRQQRWKNVAMSMQPLAHAAPIIKNKQVIIIDDVMTTGSTLIAATHALQRLQPASIRALVLARVV